MRRVSEYVRHNSVYIFRGSGRSVATNGAICMRSARARVVDSSPRGGGLGEEARTPTSFVQATGRDLACTLNRAAHLRRATTNASSLGQPTGHWLHKSMGRALQARFVCVNDLLRRGSLQDPTLEFV